MIANIKTTILRLLTSVSVIIAADCSLAADGPADQPRRPDASHQLPVFKHQAVALDYKDLKYNPCDDVIIPSVIDAHKYFAKPLGKFYMYYAPHNPPGGICLAYADSLEGPWTEYEANPIIRKDWPGHYNVSHVSGPHAIWIEAECKVFVYYHGENNVTRYASTTNGINFNYEGEAVNTKMFDDSTEASYARIFEYKLPGKDNRYIMLIMGNNKGTRRVYIALSKDGRKWDMQKTPLINPPPGTGQVAQAWYLPWRGKHYLIYHAHPLGQLSGADLHICQVDPAFERTEYLGLYYHRSSVSPTNEAAMSPCIIRQADKLYMFTNIGPRLHQKIALAVADCPDTK